MNHHSRRSIGRGLAMILVLAALPDSMSLAAEVGTAITYQGELRDNGTPVDDTCDFRFSLWDSSSGPGDVQIGSDVDQSITISDGRFTTALDFGAGAFIGQGRFLQIAVCCPTGCADSYTLLAPRQELTPAPVATSLPGLYTSETPDNMGGVENVNVLGGATPSVAAGVEGATISGGGGVNNCDATSSVNAVTDHFGTIGGGSGNTVGNGTGTLCDAPFNTIAGGENNSASNYHAAIGGGTRNIATGASATVAGGQDNAADAWLATVGGGRDNVGTGTGSTISGGVINAAGGDVASVGGGQENASSGYATTVAGGTGNVASTDYGTVGGGRNNMATGQWSTIGGGDSNAVQASYGTISGGGLSDIGDTMTNNVVYDDYGTIGGGGGNKVGDDNGDTTNRPYATVGGGRDNVVSREYGTVGGGWNNLAQHTATVAGGQDNQAIGSYNFIGGGQGNFTTFGHTTIAGGFENSASSSMAFIGGGRQHSVTATFGTVGGGFNNFALGLEASTVAGGFGNQAGASYAMSPGGASNYADGEYSFAAGRRARVRSAVGTGDADGDEGTFIWADSTDADFISTGPDQFLIRATGGVGIGKNAPSEQLDVQGNIVASGTIKSGNSITIDGSADTVTATSGTIGFDDEDLTTSGVIESTGGGFKYPDGTVQTSPSPVAVFAGVVEFTATAPYAAVNGYSPSGFSVDSRACLSPTFTVTASELIAEASASPGATLELWVNGAPSGLTCALSGGATSCSSGAAEVVIPPASDIVFFLSSGWTGTVRFSLVLR